MLTPKENLLRVFSRRPPRWRPVTGHCDPCNQPLREGMDQKLGDRITIIAGVQVLVDGPREDRVALCAAIREMVGEGQGEQLILNVVAFPHRPPAQTRRVVNCCREIGGQPDNC